MIRSIFTVAFLAVFFIISLPFYLIIPLIARVSQNNADALSQRMVCGALSVVGAISGIRVNVTGRENIPEGPVLFVGNHRSFFDIVTTYPLLKKTTGFVAKQEIDRIPLLKWWMRLLHGLTFDRDNPKSGMKMIMAAIDYVKEGYSIFIYPEGTRSKDGQVADFKAGSFKVATRTNAPVVPVAVTGTDDIFENHIPFIRGGEVNVRFLEPLYPGKMSREEKKMIANTARKRIVEAL